MPWDRWGNSEGYRPMNPNYDEDDALLLMGCLLMAAAFAPAFRCAGLLGRL